jgi:hypothetical protein
VAGFCLWPLHGAAQTVDELVARYIAARGGYEKLHAIQTIRMTRTAATPFTNVRVVISRKRPELFRAEQTPKGQPATVRAINADAAWDVAPDGAMSLRPTAAAIEARELDGDFDGLLVDWKAKGHTLVLEGKEPLTGGEAFKLKLTTKSGVVRYIYLDSATYLERRHAGTRTLPNNSQERFVIDFTDWRAVEGVMFPFSIDEDRTGPVITQSFAIYTEKIELNVPLEDSLFATPKK